MESNHAHFFRSFRLPALVVILFFAVFLSARGAEAKSPETMPHFTLPSATDETVIDSNQHSGEVLLINFWATWCGPCREEIPSLIKLRNEHRKEGFEVIGISMDEGGRAMISMFSEKFAISYPIAMGTPKVARSFGGIIGIPQSFLVDRQGKIVKSYAGLVDHDVFEKDITSLLAK